MVDAIRITFRGLIQALRANNKGQVVSLGRQLYEQAKERAEGEYAGNVIVRGHLEGICRMSELFFNLPGSSTVENMQEQLRAIKGEINHIEIALLKRATDFQL